MQVLREKSDTRSHRSNRSDNIKSQRATIDELNSFDLAIPANIQDLKSKPDFANFIQNLQNCLEQSFSEEKHNLQQSYQFFVEYFQTLIRQENSGKDYALSHHRASRHIGIKFKVQASNDSKEQ